MYEYRVIDVPNHMLQEIMNKMAKIGWVLDSSIVSEFKKENISDMFNDRRVTTMLYSEKIKLIFRKVVLNKPR